MEYDSFIDIVQNGLASESREEAEQATRAVLETLGEHFYQHKPERRHLASQLVKPLREHVLRRKSERHVTMAEFYQRVAARADCGHKGALARTGAVFDALKQAVGSGEWSHVRSELSEDYDKLFERLGLPE